jgi:hypothetical protein
VAARAIQFFWDRRWLNENNACRVGLDATFCKYSGVWFLGVSPGNGETYFQFVVPLFAHN